jgi:hypothetical protein
VSPVGLERLVPQVELDASTTLEVPGEGNLSINLLKGAGLVRRIHVWMSDFKFEQEFDVQPGVWPKLITLTGLVAFCAGILYLIF